MSENGDAIAKQAPKRGASSCSQCGVHFSTRRTRVPPTNKFHWSRPMHVPKCDKRKSEPDSLKKQRVHFVALYKVKEIGLILQRDKLF